MSEVRKSAAHYLTRPAVWLLAKTSITPSTITWFGLCLAGGATALIIMGQLLAAGFLILIAGYFDILDGALARRTDQTTRSGAILDSTVDRLSEAVVLIGILALFVFTEEQSLFTLLSRKWAILLVGLALLSSPLVSYIRARAEALKIECQVGIFTRAERVIVLALGLLVNQVTIALAIITVLSLITAGQRLLSVQKQARLPRR